MLLNSLPVKREGFETINGKPATVPDQAPKKARVLWNEEDYRDELMAKNVTPLGGFATASGKPVIVSKEALMKASRLWNDEDDGDELIPKNPTPMRGFATASGKPVNVSEEALKGVKGLWKDEDVDDELIIKSATPMGGFATASGKPVNVSEEALKRVKGLWNDKDVDDELIIKNPTPMGGFATASGKPVSVSEEALRKAKGLWSDEDVGDEQIIKNPTPMGGFATASGKPVSVSEEALRKAKGLWSDEDVGDEQIIKNPTPMGGFATASGKPVSVSEEALRKAKGLWSDEDVGDEQIIKNPTPMGGFATASGKPVSVSEEALRKAKGLWSDEDVGDELIIKNPTPMLGFATASGKPVNVSEEALRKAKGLWNDEDDGDALIPKNPTPIRGFATASGTPVIVSDDALMKASRLWNDEDLGDELILQNPTPLGGFATARGKPVNVSEEALMKAKGLWNDVYVGDELVPKHPTPKSGFATASGKLVNVSEEALEKVKGLWSDEDVVDQLISKNATPMGGFATASGISVSVSEDALMKARRLWDDRVDGGTMSVSNVYDADMAQEVPEKFCEKKKKKGFVTPFRTVGPQSTLQVNTSSNKITPVLQGSGRHPGLVKSSTGTKGLGVRAVRSAEPLKRSRNLLYDIDIGNNNSSCKTPKLNHTSSPNAFISPRKLTSEPVACATSSVLETLSPQDSCSSNINISSVTDSQMDEVLESSKALLEDADFDFDSDETQSKCMNTNTSNKPEPVQPITISSITSDDNPVRLIHAVIARSYPVVYSCKPLVGKSVFISQSCYEKLESSRESTNELEREKLFTQIQTECANARKSKQQVHLHSFKKENLEKLTIDQLLDIVDSGDDFCDIRPLLSRQKLTQLEEAHTKKHEELHREIHKEVEVRMQNLVPGYKSISAVKKIRLVDLSDMKRYREMVSQGLSPPRHAVLSLWRPSDDWQTTLVEGLAVEILLANSSQISHDEVKLNSGRGTWIQPLSKEYPPLSQDDFSQFRRQSASFQEIINSSIFRPPFSEFDVVGLIVQVDSPPAENRMGEPCQTVYLADPQKRILSLKFWKSVVDEGLASLVQVGNFVAVSNIQWRESRSTKEKIPAGFVQETTRFSLGPKETSTNEELQGLKEQIKDARSHVSACVDRIYNILNDVEEDEDEDNMEKTPPLKRRLQPYNPPNSAVRKNLMDTQEFT